MQSRHRLLAAWNRGLIVFGLLVLGGFLPAVALAVPPKYVIEISVDGLGSKYLQPLIEQGQLPNFKRMQTEGAWTNNARDDADVTVTLPNHTTMVTARSIRGPEGHNWLSNTDPAKGKNLHNTKGEYIASVFDVAHDNGLRTGLFCGKSKFSLFRDSYGATSGAEDAVPPDNGRSKIDTYVLNGNTAALTKAFIAATEQQPYQYAFIHYADPDAVGHGKGWGSNEYNETIKRVDDGLGLLFKLIQKNPKLRGKTMIILTADHGGKGNGHNDNLDPAIYTIPFYVWGRGVAAGKELYALNPSTRLDPHDGHPLHADPVQPVRNADGANLALRLLGLGAIPGSMFNSKQDLLIGKGPVSSVKKAAAAKPRVRRKAAVATP